MSKITPPKGREEWLLVRAPIEVARAAVLANDPRLAQAQQLYTLDLEEIHKTFVRSLMWAAYGFELGVTTLVITSGEAPGEARKLNYQSSAPEQFGAFGPLDKLRKYEKRLEVFGDLVSWERRFV